MLAGSLVNAASLLALALVRHILGSAITLAWIIVTIAVTGLGNMLILPTLIGIALTDIRPEQAGIASGTLNITQQFAGAAGTAFFSTLGQHPASLAGYTHAAAIAIWIDLALMLVITALSVILAPSGSERQPTAIAPPAGPPARPIR